MSSAQDQSCRSILFPSLVSSRNHEEGEGEEGEREEEGEEEDGEEEARKHVQKYRSKIKAKPLLVNRNGVTSLQISGSSLNRKGGWKMICIAGKRRPWQRTDSMNAAATNVLGRCELCSSRLIWDFDLGF